MSEMPKEPATRAEWVAAVEDLMVRVAEAVEGHVLAPAVGASLATGAVTATDFVGAERFGKDFRAPAVEGPSTTDPMDVLEGVHMRGDLTHIWAEDDGDVHVALTLPKLGGDVELQVPPVVARKMAAAFVQAADGIDSRARARGES